MTNSQIIDLIATIEDKIKELYLLVSPTAEEIAAYNDLLMDDAVDEAEALGDPQETIGQYNLALDALEQREMDKKEASNPGLGY